MEVVGEALKSNVFRNPILYYLLNEKLIKMNKIKKKKIKGEYI